MNLLIVDDEYYSAKSTMMKVERSFPGIFGEISCAYNKDQALKYFDANEVAVMICDVEMPGGSGLELLEEVRQRGLDTICIYLTAYAKFEYVSKALKLSSIDYLLKPVEDAELERVIGKALELYRERSSSQKAKEDAESWQDNRLEVAELFWTDLSRGVIRRDPEILSELRTRSLEESFSGMRCIPLLVQCLIYTAEFPIERGLYEFIIRNVLREYFYRPEELQPVVRLDETRYCLPLPEEGRTREEVIERCREAFYDFIPKFPNAFNFFVAEKPCTMAEFRDVLQVMVSLSMDNVSLENHVFDMALPAGERENSQEGGMPEERWRELLRRRDTESIYAEADIYLGSLQHSGRATREMLRGFYQGFLHLALSAAGERSGELRRNYGMRMMSVKEEEATASFGAIRNWLRQALNLYAEMVRESAEPDQAVAQVRAYIREHLAEDLSREFLSGTVYLTPDYLSHLFKKETGLSLTNYVIHERIEESKRLLAKTDLSIQEIAIRCGFQNISYFSKQFRNLTGVTPREYRK